MNSTAHPQRPKSRPIKRSKNENNQKDTLSMENKDTTFSGKNQAKAFKDQEWATLEEAAEYAHMGFDAFRGFVYSGDLAGYKPGKKILVKPVEVIAFLESAKLKVPGGGTAQERENI